MIRKDLSEVYKDGLKHGDLESEHKELLLFDLHMGALFNLERLSDVKVSPRGDINFEIEQFVLFVSLLIIATII